MATYVALLRGVNLGPTRKISMPQLRALATELGYGDVATYIASGNLIVSTAKPAATVERELTAAIEETFGHHVDVTVRTPAELTRVLDENPYPEGNPSQVTVAFLTGPVATTAADKVAALAVEGERYTFGEREIYVDYANGIGNSKLAAKFSAAVGVSATVRNVRTVGKLLELASPVA
jgi:uncharacterized protein (DUF1697 family)